MANINFHRVARKKPVLKAIIEEYLNTIWGKTIALLAATAALFAAISGIVYAISHVDFSALWEFIINHKVPFVWAAVITVTLIPGYFGPYKATVRALIKSYMPFTRSEYVSIGASDELEMCLMSAAYLVTKSGRVIDELNSQDICPCQNKAIWETEWMKNLIFEIKSEDENYTEKVYYKDYAYRFSPMSSAHSTYADIFLAASLGSAGRRDLYENDKYNHECTSSLKAYIPNISPDVIQWCKVVMRKHHMEKWKLKVLSDDNVNLISPAVRFLYLTVYEH